MISQLARATFGGGTAFYFAVQAATMLILVLAANTAYADFPRLASIVARDRFLPRQFTNQGDRLAFSNGILILSVLAAALLVAFAGDTHALIPLYMIGVFVSFTLSQAGMVIHWRRSGAPGWRASAWVNGVGALVTGVVLVIVAVTKAAEGAWLIILMIPVARRALHDHAAPLRSRGVGADPARLGAGRRRAVTWCWCRSAASSGPWSRRCGTPATPVARRARGVRRAGSGGHRRAPQAVAGVGAGRGAGGPRLTLPVAARAAPRLHRAAPPRRSVDATSRSSCPSSFRSRLWQHLLHNQHALLIKGALLFKPNVVVTSVPFHLGRQAPVPAAETAPSRALSGMTRVPGSRRALAASRTGECRSLRRV